MQPLSVVAVIAVLVGPCLAFSPAGSAPASNGIDFRVTCGSLLDGIFTCSFYTLISDWSLVFFRWDFESDGVWDTGSRSDPWINVLTLGHSYEKPGLWHVT